jgi:hypothetical protein
MDGHQGYNPWAAGFTNGIGEFDAASGQDWQKYRPQSASEYPLQNSPQQVSDPGHDLGPYYAYQHGQDQGTSPGRLSNEFAYGDPNLGAFLAVPPEHENEYGYISYASNIQSGEGNQFQHWQGQHVSPTDVVNNAAQQYPGNAIIPPGNIAQANQGKPSAPFHLANAHPTYPLPYQQPFSIKQSIQPHLVKPTIPFPRNSRFRHSHRAKLHVQRLHHELGRWGNPRNSLNSPMIKK